MIRAIALDDEIIAIKIIENYCLKNERFILERVFNRQSDAHKYFNKFPVGLIKAKNLFRNDAMFTKN